MKKLLLITLIFCMAQLVHAQVTLNTVGSAFGCASTGVELQADGGIYYWLYNQDPLPGVYPIDSNSTGEFTVYKTANYMVLATQVGLPIGLSNPATSVTIETPPVVTTTVNYYPILDYELNDANKFTFTTCGGDANLILGATFSANENVTNIDYIWSNNNVGATNLVGPGAYNCTMVTNNGCSYVSDWVSITYTEPKKPKVKNVGTSDEPVLFAKVKDFLPYDSSVPKWYQWFHGNFPVGNDSTYVPTTSGKYSVLVGQGPCTAMSKKLKVVIPSAKQEVLTNESAVSEISVYPNPATGWINITGTTGKVEMFDLTGRFIAMSSDGKIYVGNLNSGIYLIVDLENNKAIKVVIQH